MTGGLLRHFSKLLRLQGAKFFCAEVRSLRVHSLPSLTSKVGLSLIKALSLAPIRSLLWFLTRQAPNRNRRIQDRKSTRLNSSHQIISYAVFCLKKKKS